ncbi:ferritin-like domain-containing protein [Kitasatospora sp. NPDC057223]|uniref:ferritin-like domain-containing protein n=1 Tax=Kitasatospora sp. NPDC057223 TaxID=3346055 RepID=UPI0036443213
MQAPRRRTVLTLGLLAAAALLTACTGTHHEDTGEQRQPDPDTPVRSRAVAATDALLAAYDTVLAGPGAAQAAQLQSLRAELLQHRAAFAAGLPSASPSAPASASGSASASVPAGPTGVPVTTVAALGAAERQTAEARLADLPAASPDLARLLASVSAADALHAAALGDTTPVTDPAPAPVAPSPSATTAATGSPGSADSPSAAASAPPTGPGSPSPSATPLTTEAATALQGALSAEHAAVYGYGVVGARLPDDQQRADARTAYAAHEARRDSLHRELAGAGATPGAAAAGYQLPFPVGDAAGAAKLAGHIETRLTDVYANLVAALPARQRTAAANALRGSALQARRWGAAPAAFPGVPEQAATATPSATAPADGSTSLTPGPSATR